MPKKIDYNSIANQEIKKQFVNREVFCCFSYEMEAIFRAAPGNQEYPLPLIEEVENLYVFKCPECGKDHQIEAEALSCCDTEKEVEREPQEVFEWWIISEYLYDKLKEKGEPVLDWGSNHYWGRTCSGQGILLDHVISEICAEMEILAGQINSWERTGK